MYRSDDEVLELFAVSEGLLSEEISENGNNDVVGVVSGVLNDGIGKEEDNSDILEAVGGKQESNSFPFDDVSDLNSRLVLVAFVQHLLSKPSNCFNGLRFLSHCFNNITIVKIIINCTLSSTAIPSFPDLPRPKFYTWIFFG